MTMALPLDRRDFLGQAILGGAAAVGLAGGILARAPEQPAGAPFTLTVISGKPRERGRQYGDRYKADIRAMIDREIYKRLVKPGQKKDDMLRYAGACAQQIKAFA